MTYRHPTVVWDASASMGEGTQIWQYSSVQKGAVIGSNCSVGQSVNIGPYVNIGDGCKIQNNVSIYEGVTLDNHVFCGPSMVFTNVHMPRAAYPAKKPYLMTHVKEGATIGANATIVCGHTLGKYCFIGAGTVVVSSVLDFALVVGNPGRQIGWVSRAAKRLDFAAQSSVFCEVSQHYYQLEKGQVIEYKK